MRRQNNGLAAVGGGIGSRAVGINRGGEGDLSVGRTENGSRAGAGGQQARRYEDRKNVFHRLISLYIPYSLWPEVSYIRKL